jgi:hypothetical protein
LSGGKFNFATFLIVGQVYTVKSEDVQLAVLNGCEPGPGSEFKVFIFSLDDGQFAFALPRSLEEQFLGFKWPDGFSNFALEVDQTINLLPPPLIATCIF